MYAGYVLFCNNKSQEQCLNQKLYTCADRKTLPLDKIKSGSTIFLYNTDTKTLLGPFTAPSEQGEKLEEGSWAIDIDEHTASENVKIEWEELHLLQNASEELPFLKNPKSCALSETQTQRALDVLKKAPLFVYGPK
jgi:hypothetical protein